MKLPYKPGVPELVLGVGSLLLYARTLAYGFLYDDHTNILENQILLQHLFSAAHYGQSAGVTLVRPVTGYWMQLNFSAFGLNPAGWHAAVVLLNMVVVLLFYAVLNRLLKNQWAALGGAVLFAVHPAHVENVVWVSAVNDLLMSIALLLSFLTFLRWRENNAPLLLVLSLLACFVGLFSKETAAVFPLMLLVYVGLESDGNLYGRLKTTVAQVWMYFAALTAYGIYHSMMQQEGGASATAGTQLVRWQSTVLTAPSVLWFEVQHLLMPLRLSEYYPGVYVTSAAASSFWFPLIGLTVLAAFVCWLVIRWRERRLAGFALLWIGLPLLPTLYLRALTPNDFLHDRFLYYPSMGLALLLMVGVQQLPASMREAAGCAVAVLALAGICGVLINQPQWQNDVTLCTNGLRFVPDSSKVRDNLGGGLVQQGRYEEAVAVYQENIARAPGYWQSYFNLGYEYLREGRARDAEPVLLRGIQVDARNARQYIVLAAAQLTLGKLEDAERNARQAFMREPGGKHFHAVMGDIYLQKGERELAWNEYQKELMQDPSSRAAREAMRRMQYGE